MSTAEANDAIAWGVASSQVRGKTDPGFLAVRGVPGGTLPALTWHLAMLWLAPIAPLTEAALPRRTIMFFRASGKARSTRRS